MCSVCGCGTGEIRIEKSGEAGEAGEGAHSCRGRTHGHDHGHGPFFEPGHTHGHLHSEDGASELFQGPRTVNREGSRLVQIEKSILSRNQAFADENRSRWRDSGVLALNLISSPGAGKTSLLVATLEQLSGAVAMCVIEGDQETSNDAERIRKTGAPAIQINTGRGCHLDAHTVGHAAEHLPLARGGILFVENIGNLVCPSGFDLGETKRVVILSVTEGADKPIKYPDAFASADVLVLSKVDLLAHVDFDEAAAIELARRVNPAIEILRTSIRPGPAISEWTGWLLRERQRIAGNAAQAGWPQSASGTLKSV